MIIKRNEVNLVKKTKIKERKISFKRIETWIPKQEQQPNAGSSIERAAATHEQQPNASSSSSQNRSRSTHEQHTSGFLDREQFQQQEAVFWQLAAARAVPATFGSNKIWEKCVCDLFVC